ncbi:ArdC family protein [Nocardioides sp. NPDC058538]|uniref:ArdC family protein n=1 Tax=Nocardioides sp. NPDC058538 TaxID=3346542 RepID=UPI003668CBA8
MSTSHDSRGREQQIDALQKRLASTVESLVTGDDWRRSLEFAAKFRARSFRNTMLIAAQHIDEYAQGLVPNPTPTYVAGFRQWQGLGRSVIKGQHGYQLLAPVKARFASTTPADPDSWRRLARGEKPRGGEAVRSKMVGVRVAYAFDISQTEGDPIPAPPQPVKSTGTAREGLWDGLADQITARGFDVRLVSDSRSLGGADARTEYLTRQVSVRMNMSDLEQATALCHELAHIMLHAPGNPDAVADAEAHRGVREVEAESVSLMVAAAHGLDTSRFTIPYVSTWAGTVRDRDPVEVVQSTAERVRATALAILDKLDTERIGDGDPPGLTREGTGHQSSFSLEGTPAMNWSKPVNRVEL